MLWKNGLYREKRGMCTIISDLADIPRLTQSLHCFSANISSTIINVQKRIFSLWSDDFAHVIVFTAHASLLNVTLMRIYEVSQNCKFSLKMLYLANMCVYYSFRDDFEWCGKRLISPKKRYIYNQFGLDWHAGIDAVITLFQCNYHLHKIQCAKTHFQPLTRRFCPCDCIYCARQCTWCHFNAHVWSYAELQIFT